MTPLNVDGKEIDSVSKFLYSGSVVSTNGQMELDVNMRIAQILKAFGAL